MTRPGRKNRARESSSNASAQEEGAHLKQNVNQIDPLERKACGLYLRVSTERQAQIKEGSLDTQLGTLKKFCEIKSSHGTEEWEVAEVYREEGKSGKNTDRPEYQKMIQDIKQGKLNVILCTKIDRIHRSLMDFYRLHELLEKHNVAFVSLNENWDTSTPMGRFGLKLTLAVAELEREQTSQRTREKLAWRAEEGLWNGGQILGYDIDPDNKGVLKVNSDRGQDRPGNLRDIPETWVIPADGASDQHQGLPVQVLRVPTRPCARQQ